MVILQAVCWSPDGAVLLFATVDEPIIYSLTFSPNVNSNTVTVGGSKAAVDVVNLAEVDWDTEHGKIRSVPFRYVEKSK